MPWWKQITEGIGLEWERAFDNTDKYNYALTSTTKDHGSENMSTMLYVKLQLIEQIPIQKGQDHAVALRTLLQNAWVVLRYAYPIIAAKVADTKDKFLYKVPEAGKGEIEQWLKETFITTEDYTFQDIMINPTPFCMVHYFPKSFELCFHFPLTHVDPTLAAALLGEYMKKVVGGESEAAFGDEYQRLPPSFTDVGAVLAAGITQDASKSVEEGNQMLKYYKSGLPSIGLPTLTLRGKPAPREASRMILHGAPGVWQKFREVCSQRGTTLQSAFHAALVVAVQELKLDVASASAYTTLVIVNCLKLLPAPLSTPGNWVGNSTMRLPLTLPAGTFDEHLKNLDEAYNQPISMGDGGVLGAYNHFLEQVTPYVGKDFVEIQTEPSRLTPTLFYFGDFDQSIMWQYHGPCAKIVVEFVEPAVEMMDSTTCLSLWTFRENFYLSANFNEAYVSPGEGLRLVRRIYLTLLRELGLDPAQQGDQGAAVATPDAPEGTEEVPTSEMQNIALDEPKQEELKQESS